MRVLLVHHIFTEFGGGEEIMYNEAQLLRKNGHEVHFFSTDKKPYLEEDYKYANFFAKYVKFHNPIQALLNWYKPFYNFEAEKKIDALIKEIKPDIIHCHNIFYYLTPSILRACKKNNVPVVMTLHDVRLICPAILMKNQQPCKDAPCVGGNIIHCLINRCKYGSFIASLVVSLENIFNKAHKLFDTVSLFICPSLAIMNLCRKEKIKESRLALLNNFVPDAMFKKQPVYTNKNYFLFAGRLENIKNIPTLIKAMSMLPKEVELHIAGRGPQETELKELAKELKLDNIKFLGFIKNQELENEYKNCIAMILPTNGVENFPVSVIEAFVYGKPVIGSKMGGTPELVEHEKTGLVFDPENVEELAKYIEKLYYNSELAVEYGKNGRAKAEKLYCPDAHYPNLINIYENVVKNHAD